MPSRTMSAPDGLLIIDKPAGWTSHDVVGRCRRLAATRRVGHAGTLDPMATGVLIVGVGRATRLLGHLALTTKSYDATMRLGQSTISDDADGEVVDTGDASQLTDERLGAAVAGLTGDLMQVPSAVSAIKVDGQRAYQRVRSGEQVNLAARPVQVSAFEVRAARRHGPFVDVDVEVDCSTGTYVRALARDLGATLGVGGHLTALRRTRVGPYGLDRAVGLDALGATEASELPIIAMAAAAADSFATYDVDGDQRSAVINGRSLDVDLGAAGPVALFGPGGALLALYEQRGPVARPIAVFPPPPPA